jgi:hypothetical protein
MVGYDSACSFDFSISPLNLSTNLGMMYGFGWGVPFLIILVQSISGYFDTNEDIELMRQRRDYAAQIDQVMESTEKSRGRSHSQGDSKEASRVNTIVPELTESNRDRLTGVDKGVEMDGILMNKRVDEFGVGQLATNLLFTATHLTEARQRNRLAGTGNKGPMTGDRSHNSNSRISITAPPQQIRSMLDV